MNVTEMRQNPGFFSVSFLNISILISLAAFRMGYREVCLVLIVCFVAAHAKDHQKNDVKLTRKMVVHQTGCSGSDQPLCCNAKNNTCRVFGARMNNENSTTCFCDSACGELGDCCVDYKKSCKRKWPSFLAVLIRPSVFLLRLFVYSQVQKLLLSPARTLKKVF